MTNRLALHLSDWKWWYFLLIFPAVIAGSQAGAILQIFGSEEEEGQGLASLISSPLGMVAMAALALLFVRIASRRPVTVQDLGLRPSISLREIALVALVFFVSQFCFWLLARGTDTSGQAATLFRDFGFGKGLLSDLSIVFSAAILAPVCEELVYRGVAMRALHDAIARNGRVVAAAVVGLLASAIAFALPHLGDSLTSPVAIAYVLSGIAFGLVYLLTGSLTAAMVSHSLQSCHAFGSILLAGSGTTPVSMPVLVVALGAPLWVFLCARLLCAWLPRSR